MTPTNYESDSTRVAFVCVRNAGRSQIANAIAEREREGRDLDVTILTGGTQPADHVHEEVIEVMREAGFDLSERTPRKITSEELRSCEYVATMGCSALDIDEPAVDVRDWDLPDPDGESRETVREIRDEVSRRVGTLFDEIADSKSGRD